MRFGRDSFQLSRVGANIGTLEVFLGDGGGSFPTLLDSYTGPAEGDWNAQFLTLPTPLPASGSVQFQFVYTRGANFDGDLAIDDFCLY